MSHNYPGTCPECNQDELIFDPGEEMTRNDPGYAPEIFCNACGHILDDPPEIVINDVVELATKYAGWECDSVEKANNMLSRSIFKYTDSGVVFHYDPVKNMVSIVPYVEGFDGELELSFEMTFPFKLNDFSENVETADKIGSHIWICVNEHDDDCGCAFCCYLRFIACYGMPLCEVNYGTV